MSKYKYPYINDKTMYKAVLFACSMLRDNGYFNKACEISANYYSVNLEELKNHVIARTTAGRKAQQKNAPKRKYKWFTCCDDWINGEGDQRWCSNPRIKKALNEKNAQEPIKYGNHPYFPDVATTGIMGQYDTQKEAERNLKTDYENYKKANTY